ncbi:uncharacterized protein TNCV_3605791 [Trichonephila clavipes]|uniref:Reverse transcriptase domain-containing protein n=1 Tax=Trichonephila clavipes TaxID=2585209 RepID=A0A8X6RIB0_TRICX|nr:uncharacterized protein TNCV_3605791 [Trichonephila clavipes]
MIHMDDLMIPAKDVKEGLEKLKEVLDVASKYGLGMNYYGQLRCCPRHLTMVQNDEIVRVQYFVRGGFVGYRSHASSKHLSPHLPVDGARFLGGQKGVALQVQDARVGVGATRSRLDVDVWRSDITVSKIHICKRLFTSNHSFNSRSNHYSLQQP